jgi:mRNA-degrading endonuclease RelE of RelBE toxin-antitoxin system
MKVYLSDAAGKQFDKLPTNAQRKIEKKLKTLSVNPYEGKKLEGEFGGKYTLRAWPYRIIYQIDLNKKGVFVNTILHRQGVYK